MPSRAVSLILALAAASAAPAAPGDFKARLWPTAEKTRLVVETPDLVEYRILSLQNPPRLVLDVDGMREFPSFGSGSDVRSAAAYLGGMRTARRDGDTMRMVFDLDESVNYEVRTMQPVGGYAHRLILDIRPQKPPDPLLALIKSMESEKAQSDAPLFRVLIDPGHGGEDPGAVSKNGVLEKDIVLAVSKLLRDEINRRPGMRAFLSREDDRFLPLAQRVLIAHRLEADVFVSVHADSVESPKARGSSVFVLSGRGASSKLAQRLARHANLSDLVGGDVTEDPQINAALLAFSKDGKDRASRRLAMLIQSNVAGVNTMHKKHTESAGFAVLKSPSIPSVLVETAFISNPEEEKKLLNDAFRRRMARAIADGLQQYRDRYEVAER